MEEKEFGEFIRKRKAKELIDPKKNLFFAASETLNISAGSSWHSLGTGDPEISYNTVKGKETLGRPILEDHSTSTIHWGPVVNTFGVSKDYFQMVWSTLEIIQPGPSVWIALEFFSRLLPTDKPGTFWPSDTEIVKEAYAYLFFVQELRIRYPKILIVLPLTWYFKGITLPEYIIRQRYTYKTGMIMQKLCAKLNILVIPTQGWIEAFPIVGENGHTEYFSACLSPLSQLTAIRNSDGISLNREGRRRFHELMHLYCKATDYAKITIQEWCQRQVDQSKADIDPTILQNL
jgi:hypothetical protein